MKTVTTLLLAGLLAGCYTMPTQEEWTAMTPEERQYHELRIQRIEGSRDRAAAMYSSGAWRPVIQPTPVYQMPGLQNNRLGPITCNTTRIGNGLSSTNCY